MTDELKNLLPENEGINGGQRVKKVVKRLGLGLVVLGLVAVLGIGGVTWKVKKDYQQGRVSLFKASGQNLAGEASVSGQIMVSDRVSYDLIEGWNFVAFPIEPINFRNAEDLIADVAEKGGYVTVVSRWDGDGWQELAQRGDGVYGENFEIRPGEAYFILNHQPISWEVVGLPVDEAGLAEYELNEGWNAIGFLDEGLRAKTIIDEINQGEEKATIIDWWTKASNWELFIKRIYSEGEIQEYGENFEIKKDRGYMILLSQPVKWRGKQ